MTSPDTTYWPWRHEQGEGGRPLKVPVQNAEGNPFSIEGWTMDCVIKTRPGGSVLHTFPENRMALIDDGETIELTIPAPVSATWTWTTGWWRLKVRDPESDPANPTVERIASGPFILDLE